jgi:hypothetical protein
MVMHRYILGKHLGGAIWRIAADHSQLALALFMGFQFIVSQLEPAPGVKVPAPNVQLVQANVHPLAGLLRVWNFFADTHVPIFYKKPSVKNGILFLFHQQKT